MNTLKEARIGQTVRVEKLGGDGALRQHFLDMGIIPGTEITLVKYAPMGDPLELRLHGYELTLRLADAAQIEVSEAEEKKTPSKKETRKKKNRASGSWRGRKVPPKGQRNSFASGNDNEICSCR